jgi:hypothetical protein
MMVAEEVQVAHTAYGAPGAAQVVR